MWKRQVFSNSFWSVGDYLITRLAIVLATNIIVARALSPSGYGIFSVALTVAQTMWIVTDFGISLYAVREVAKAPNPEKQHEIAKDFQSLRFILAMFIFGWMVISLFVLRIEAKWTTPVILSGIFILIYSLYPDWYFRAIERFRGLAIANAVSSVIYVSAVFIFVRDPEDISIACALWACSFLPSTAILFIWTSREKGSLISIQHFTRIFDILSHLRETKYFLYSAIFSNIYISMPIYLLTWLASETEVGFFSSSYRLYIYISSILLPVSQVFYPLLSKAYPEATLDEFKGKQNYFLRMGLILILPASLVSVMFGKEIIVFLYGQQFETGAWTMSYFSLPMIFSTIRLTLANPIAASGQQKYLAYASFASALVSTLIGYLAILDSGLAGAVLMVIVGEIVFVTILVIMAGKYISIPFLDIVSGCPLKVVPALMLMGGVMWMAKGFSISVIMLGFLLYGLTLLLLGEFDFLKEGAEL